MITLSSHLYSHQCMKTYVPDQTLIFMYFQFVLASTIFICIYKLTSAFASSLYGTINYVTVYVPPLLHFFNVTNVLFFDRFISMYYLYYNRAWHTLQRTHIVLFLFFVVVHVLLQICGYTTTRLTYPYDCSLYTYIMRHSNKNADLAMLPTAVPLHRAVDIRARQ